MFSDAFRVIGCMFKALVGIIVILVGALATILMTGWRP